ncbi:MAG TPA: GNAT family protein [Ktedonobacterales bacterium]|nr:GNAT family protein [Ktedonobacterales bacterium]
MARARANKTGEAMPNEAENTPPIINIYGERIALGPMARAHVPFLYRWENDFAVALFSGDPLIPHFREESEADFERYSKQEARTWVSFAIYELATLRFIGETELRHIEHVRGSAEFGIMIGERDCWGKGYGTEAARLLLDYGFHVLGLHNIMLDTYSYNERAIRAYKRAGFREFGRRRECQRLGDRWYDIVYMDCLASEFTSPLRPIVVGTETPTVPAAEAPTPRRSER